MVSRRRSWTVLGVLAVTTLAAVGLGGVLIEWSRDDEPAPGAAVGRVVVQLASLPTAAPPRDLDPYVGLGTWVDGFDFGPAYQPDAGPPPVSPADLDSMAAAGVRTLYLQASRDDTRSPGGIVDPLLVGRFLLDAHRLGIKVVAWYLPRFRDVETDVTRLIELSTFEVAGHRFDGIAVDIEYTEDVPDHDERNARLITISERVRAATGDDVLGAIVLPPVQIEVVNPSLWPEFPYQELRPYYDVWLPMSYWTFRSESSGYNDGYTYNEESIRRLRANLGDHDVAVHGIGGIGDLASAEDLELFARSLVDTGSVGGSIYDWQTLTPASRVTLATHFSPGGVAAALSTG